jgi:hypothetical protein
MKKNALHRCKKIERSLSQLTLSDFDVVCGCIEKSYCLLCRIELYTPSKIKSKKAVARVTADDQKAIHVLGANK